MARRITRESFGGYGVDERVLRRGDECDEYVIQNILGIYTDIDEQADILQNENAISSHYIGEQKVYHTFSRRNGTKPYHYAGLCAFQDTMNLHPKASRRTFIISQYHAEDPETVLFHEEFTKCIARSLVMNFGDIPVAPHLYFPQFMEDEGWSREFGIEAGHILMQACDSVIVATIDGYISDGMKADIEYATVQLGIRPKWTNYTKEEAEEYIEETRKEIYENRSRA